LAARATGNTPRMPSWLATPPTTETRSDAPATWPGRRLFETG